MTPLPRNFLFYDLLHSISHPTNDDRVEEKRKLEEKIAAKFFAQQYLG